jgi:hypothetical protein
VAYRSHGHTRFLAVARYGVAFVHDRWSASAPDSVRPWAGLPSCKAVLFQKTASLLTPYNYPSRMGDLRPFAPLVLPMRR